MSLIHSISSFVEGSKINGVVGLQSSQRDFSPYLVHLTSYDAMIKLHSVLRDGIEATKVTDILERADNKSFEVFSKILSGKLLKSNIPLINETEFTIPFTIGFICFTECSLSGILSQSEIFGRFGLIFKKSTLFDLGARPCIYVGGEGFKEIKELHEYHSSPSTDKLFHLANYLQPTRPGIRDFTHEREWRHFGSIKLDEIKPVGYIVPSRYIEQMRPFLDDNQFVLPIDILFEMGL